MESSLFDFDQIKKLTNFGIKKYSDAIYRGEIQGGKRNGKGVMLYKKNRVYEGDWVNDVRQGRGYERYQNGNKYEGDFLNGKAHGKGVYQWANGEIYDGEWKNGVKDGYGIWKGVFGDSYIGEWKNSKADGYGVHQWKNGDRYEGEWAQCLKHGQGSDIFANGDSYTGQYKFGKPDGNGQYKWKNGSVYIGEFKDGLKHGRGKWKKQQNVQNCNSYDGDYQNDKKNGYGVFTWESGNVYKGNYKEDERDGYGEMFWIDGSYYQGEWRRGIQHGFGKMTFPDGSIKEGKFENNVFIEPKAPLQPTDSSQVQSPVPFQSKKLPLTSPFGDSEDKNSPNTSSIISGGGERFSLLGAAGSNIMGINGNAEIKSQVSTNSVFTVRAMSRGKASTIARQITNGSMMSFQSNVRPPDKLGPVKPPLKPNDGNNSSNEYDYGYGGYSSPGQDSDSTRVSNILYSKMSIQKPSYTNRDGQNHSSMQKPPRMALIMKNTNDQSSLNNSTNHGYHSNNEQQPSFLPEIKRVFSKSSQRTQLTQISEQMNKGPPSGIGGIQGTTSNIRKASPEAIAIMMQNIQQNKTKNGPLSNAGSGNMSGNESSGAKPWMPSGVQTKADNQTNRIKKIVF